MKGWFKTTLVLALATSVPAVAQEVPGLAVERAILSMRPGQYHWDDTGEGGPVAIVISVPMQMAFVYRGNRLVGASTVSTGKPGKMTPIGEYTILQKRPFHRSNLYANAPMPFMQRLTWTGIAIHGGDLPGYPASHGCVRIPTAFAKRLFALTELGGKVAVINETLAFPAYRPADPPRTLPVVSVDWPDDRAAQVVARR